MSDFYGPAAPVDLGDPRADPPMTVRVCPDDDPRSPDARRVIRTDTGWWLVVTCRWGSDEGALMSSDVATWPVQHPIVYCTAFRHAAHRASVTAEPVGDMDVDAFRTGKATS